MKIRNEYTRLSNWLSAGFFLDSGISDIPRRPGWEQVGIAAAILAWDIIANILMKRQQERRKKFIVDPQGHIHEVKQD